MYASSGYRVYGQEQVIPGDFSIGDYYIDEATFAQLAQYATQEGDVLISCVGTFGKIAVVPESAELGIINPRLIRLRVVDKVSSSYLAEVLRSTVTFEQFSVLSRGGTMDVINIGTLSDIWVAVPPYSEQQSILEKLQRLMREFDALVDEAVLSIELLRERRSALISAAVTGQIDVRGWESMHVD
ncbi:restriction endonuclease subunit S [Ideonella paludis]